jgi:2-(1,2-epoxy-1,2-dihydrophenyl)acetyl-CoA isomerase
MHEELRFILTTLEQDRRLRALVISGAGRAFCAGQDLNERARMVREGEVDLGLSLEQWYEPLILRLRGLQVPVIAAVNGIAAGAGASLAFACDIVVAARSASFLQSFGKVGLVPDCGASWFIPRLVGRARACGLLMLAEHTSAEDAERMGLIWKCVDDDQLVQTIDSITAQLVSYSPQALQRTKRLLNESFTKTLEQQLTLEAHFQRELGKSGKYRDSVLAFAEKRPPVPTSTKAG